MARWGEVVGERWWGWGTGVRYQTVDRIPDRDGVPDT